MKSVLLYVGLMMSLVVLSGCAEFDQWAKKQGQGVSLDEFDYVSPMPVSASTPPSAADVQTAVDELRVYLKDQETRIGGLLQMRAELEGQIQEVREQVFVPLRDRVETFEGRLNTQGAQVTTLSTKLDTALAPLGEVVTAQGGRLDQHDKDIVLLIESANQDKEAMRTNLQNFREALVGFHSIMNNLETLVFDEEFRATNAEARLTSLITEETKQREQLWTVSNEQGSTVARLQEQIKGLAALESRVVALHSYINQVRQGMTGKIETLRSQTVSQRGRARQIHTQPRGSGLKRTPPGGRKNPPASVVPGVETLIAPIPEMSTNGASPLSTLPSTDTPGVEPSPKKTTRVTH